MIWLLVLAIPAQGVAAATMAFCGPNHHSGGSATIAQQATAEHRHQALDVQAAHYPHDEAQAVDSASNTDEIPAATKFVNADKHTCSACASCCSAAAIFNTALVVPAPELTPTAFVAVVPAVDNFAADGLDRPPRIHLA